MYIKEVFSRPGESSKRIEQQEYWELRILEPGELSNFSYYVIRSRVGWSAIDCGLVSEEGDSEPERFPTLESAKQAYEAKRVEIIKQGFSESDMDF